MLLFVMTSVTRTFILATFLSAPTLIWGQTLKPIPVPDGVTGFRAEFLREMSGEEAKLMSLAQSIPADKYTWRPTADVRSVSEVLLHAAGANYAIAKIIGIKPPEGFSAVGYDKSTTDKAKILEIIPQSFEHLRANVAKLSDADGDKPVKLYGDNTYRGATYFMVKHMAEHTGQMIAYTRMLGIVPAWTEEQQKAQAAKPAAK
jgi:uncharacterized damage-inducible protein DinB